MVTRRSTRIATIMSAIVLTVLLVVSCEAQDIDWLTRPGTIGSLSNVQDGSHVYIDAVVIDKIKSQSSPPYFTVKECFSQADRLVALSPPDARLRLGQLLDVEGDLVTLDNGDRAIQNVTVWGYTDESGTLLTHGGPLIKGIYEATPWDYKIDLTVASSSDLMSSTNAIATDSLPNELPDTTSPDSPTFYSSIGDVLSGTSTQSQTGGSQSLAMTADSLYGSIGDLQGLSDGSLVELQAKRITGVGTETIDTITYNYVDVAEDSPSTDWIRAYSTRTDVLATDRVNRITGQIRHVDTVPVICVDDGPGYDPQVFVGQLQTAAEGTIAYARTSLDGATVTISGKLVTAEHTSNHSDFSGNRLYIEEPERGAGIKVVYTGSTDAARGVTVDVTGTVGTDSTGERYISVGSNDLTVTNSTPSPLAPLGKVNKDLGGGDFNVYTLGVNTPQGYGLYDIGSLSKCWGTVTGIYESEKCFYIDDGSNLDDGTEHVKGLKVSWDWQPSGNTAISVPSLGSYVSVTGISGCESPITGTVIRVLRVRDNDDVVTHNTPASTTEVDRGLPTTNLNEASGTSRCNIRWVDASDNTCYGDSFSLPEGDWVVDKITIWAVPQAPVSPTYHLGDVYLSVTLYGGTTSNLSQLLTGTFTAGTDATTNHNIAVTTATYSGGQNYQCADGEFNRMWQIDFNNLNWQVSGETPCVFGVRGASAIDRLWFNHATNDLTKPGADGVLYQFDVTNLGLGASTVDPSGWFGSGSDINVQVSAHSR